MLTAALDVARLGGRAPLPADLLRAAAPGYCTSAQQAEAPASWFEQALAYATAKLHGAAAALAPAAGAGMGQVAGYTVADYLLQHASRERRPARVPASTWDALLSHLRDPADAARLADSAHGRLLYRYAIPLYRRAADAGDGYAAMRLAALLYSGMAAYNRGDLDQLLARADAGDRYAAEMLAELRARRGDVDRLRAQAAGNGTATVLGAQYPSGAGDGDVDGLRARADAGDDLAAMQLAGLLVDRGDLDELRARADAGDRAAAWQLADLLFRRGDLDELRARADAGDGAAAIRLAALLAERGDLDQLRARADAGDGAAAGRLAERGDLDQAKQLLRARADAGDEHAAMQLAGHLAALLARRGQGEEAERLRRFGLNPDGSIACA